MAPPLIHSNYDKDVTCNREAQAVFPGGTFPNAEAPVSLAMKIGTPDSAEDTALGQTPRLDKHRAWVRAERGGTMGTGREGRGRRSCGGREYRPRVHRYGPKVRGLVDGWAGGQSFSADNVKWGLEG